MFKKADITIIVAVSLTAVLLAFLLYKPQYGKKVRISVNNKVIAEYKLSSDITEKITTDYGENTLVIKDGAAYITNSDCPDKICEKSGKISRVGQSIVCLPHKLAAEVVE